MRIFAALFVLSGGCYATLQPHLAESTDVLAPRAVNLTVAGGGAVLADHCCSGTAVQEVAGFEARVRVGIGRHQEVGASMIGGIGSSVGNGDPPFALGGTLSYKVAPVRWFALVASGGAVDMSAASLGVFSGSLAAIVAPYTAANGTQLYVGARGAFSVPMLPHATAVNELLSIPIGVSIHTGDRVRVLAEAGLLCGWGQLRNDFATTSNTATSPGGYGLLAVTYLFH